MVLHLSQHFIINCICIAFVAGCSGYVEHISDKQGLTIYETGEPVLTKEIRIEPVAIQYRADGEQVYAYRNPPVCLLRRTDDRLTTRIVVDLRGEISCDGYVSSAQSTMKVLQPNHFYLVKFSSSDMTTWFLWNKSQIALSSEDRKRLATFSGQSPITSLMLPDIITTAPTNPDAKLDWKSEIRGRLTN